MLSVLQVIPTLDRSGAEKQMALLAAMLPRDRFRVEVAALTRLGPLAAELRAAGIPVTLIGKRHKVDPFALIKLSKLMKARKFDVVQTWIFAANVYGRVAARRAGVPVTVVAEMAVDLWKSGVHREIDRRLAHRTDRVVGNSPAVVDYYRGLGIAGTKLTCIPSGIAVADPPEVDPSAVRAELGLPAGCPLAIFVGRLAEQKRVEDLLAALDLLRHVRPALRTLIVGDGPLRAALHGRADAFRLGDAARFLGHREDVPRLLAAADMLVLPSDYEGLPNVVLEAMNMSKPVVATSAPGTTEVVADSVTGLLVPRRSPTDLARAIRSLVDDPSLGRRLGAAGRARVEAEFRAEAMVGRFAALYEELARAKGLVV